MKLIEIQRHFFSLKDNKGLFFCTEAEHDLNLNVANKLGIPDKTAEKHIKRFAVNGLINHYAHDKYKKP